MKRLLSILVIPVVIFSLLGAQGPKYVALTFDDGPSGKFTREMLEGLEERGAKATFFLCGYRLAENREIAQEILDGGHEIGCHGYSHRDLRQLSHREMAKEIEDTLALLPEGTPVRFLRPPGGAWDRRVCNVAQARGLAILGWNLDPRDWASHDVGAIEGAILDGVQDGDVILMHDMSDSSVEAALYIVDELQKRGFQFVTATRLCTLRDCRTKIGCVYRCFPPRNEEIK